jgi:hypothetical protein
MDQQYKKADGTQGLVNTDKRGVRGQLAHNRLTQNRDRYRKVFGLYPECRRRHRCVDLMIRALRIKRLEGSRCGGGRLCDLNTPMDADGCGISPICSLVAEIDCPDRGEAGFSGIV